MFSLFNAIYENDPKCLVDFIVGKLHKELNKANNNNLLNKSESKIDKTNKKEVYDDFINYFEHSNQSIIIDLFYGINSFQSQCLGCQKKFYGYNTPSFFIFPLEAVRQFKVQKLENEVTMNANVNILNNNSINLDDCFEYYEKIEIFTGENSMDCSNCNKISDFSYQNILYTTPEILIIALSTGKDNEFKVKLEFDETLNLYNYVEKKEAGYMYKLIGVVSYFEKNGASGENGHFMAHCRSPINDKWYKYNDDLVSEVMNVKQEIIDFDMPYILFFKKINN